MPGPTRTKDSAADDSDWKPPRPPNAWILYRSDKTRQLPPIEPGAPRRAQSDVSKLISQMWKSETEQTRAEYERRADAKKAEHALLYPNYRFQPQTKEQKEHSRIQKKKAKASKRKGGQSSAAQVSTAGVAPPTLPLPPPQLSPYYRDVRYEVESSCSSSVSGAPSPAVQAQSPGMERYSSSPNGLSSDAFLTPDSFTGGSGLPIMSALHFPYPSSQSNPPSSKAPSYGVPLPEPPRQAQEAVRWEQPSAVAQSSQNVPLTRVNNAPPKESQPEPTPTASEFLEFDIHPHTMQVLQNWADEQPQSFADSLRTHLSGTTDPSVFQLCIDPEALAAEPVGEIEVSMGHIPFPHDLFNLEYPGLQFDASSNDPLNSLSTEPIPDFNTLFSPDSNGPTDYNLDDFLNYDGVPSQEIQPTFRPPVQIEQRPVDPPEPSAARYIPPSGAAYSANRRVAASWKTPFTMDSPIDHNLLRSWGVPAT